MLACKEGSVFKDLPPGDEESPWMLVDFQGRGDEMSVLLQRKVTDKWVDFAFLEPDGKVIQVAQVPEAAKHPFSVAQVAMPNGKRCAVYVVSDGNVHLACDDGTSEDSGVEIDAGYMAQLFPIVFPTGDLVVFGQSFASFTAVARSPNGMWQEIEQNESSISWPTSTWVSGDTAAVCYINSAGHAVVRVLGQGEITSAIKAKRCNIAVDASSVYVLLDTGFAKIAPAALSGGQGTFAVKPTIEAGIVLAMGIVGGEPFAVLTDPLLSKLLRVNLTSGDTVELVEDNFVALYRARFDAEAGALTVVSLPLSSSSGSDSGTQTIQIAEYCTADW